MTADLDLDFLRSRGMRLLAVTAAVLALATVAGAVVFGGSRDWTAALLALALAAPPCMLAMQQRIDGAARAMTSVSVLALPALLLFVFRTASWQEDIHMVFFATLAMVAMLCDWRAIVAGAGIVALHHLLLGMIVPDWVFHGGGSIARIAFP